MSVKCSNVIAPLPPRPARADEAGDLLEHEAQAQHTARQGRGPGPGGHQQLLPRVYK